MAASLVENLVSQESEIPRFPKLVGGYLEQNQCVQNLQRRHWQMDKQTVTTQPFA